MRTTMLVMVVLSALLGACEPEEDPEAPAKCRVLVDAICARSRECSMEPLSTCQQRFATELNCAAAIQIGEQYTTCMGQVQTFQCRVLTTSGLPASCAGVVGTK